MAYSRKKIIGSAILKLLERTCSQLIAFAVTIILARILMPEEYGIIAILMVFINIANVIVDGGLSTALIQKKESDNIDFSTIFVFSIALATIIYAFLYIIAPYIAQFYDNKQLIPVLRVLGLVIFFQSFNAIQRAYISKYMLFSKLLFSSLGATALSGIVGISMAYLGYGVWALVSQQVVNQLANVTIMWFTVEWHPKIIFAYDRFKGLFSYGWKIFTTNIIVAIYEDVRSLLIGKIYQPSALAYFDRGKQFPNLIMSNINASMQTILLPVFADVQEDRMRVKQMIKRSVDLTNFFVFPFLILVIVAAKPLVLFVLTEKWIDAVPFIRIFCIAYLFMPIQDSNMSAIRALGYSGITLKLEIIKKVIEAAVLVVSFTINVYAVAWGIVLYNFISLFVNLYPCKKILNYGIWEQIIDLLPNIVIAIVAGGFTYCITELDISPFVMLLIQTVMYSIIYLLLNKILKTEGYLYLKEMLSRNIRK